ncbi:hypothetical protein DSO57_1025801 [Entomophthora muscae]|uniref:Uncharacterized protein n=1 Tax=Entomophthora muscae TaxID=34485 RepID=A0ACC2SR91_9FUNG|nr:hypothetical protein DSO57_1025801 [Entomophthora muscae]
MFEEHLGNQKGLICAPYHLLFLPYSNFSKFFILGYSYVTFHYIRPKDTNLLLFQSIKSLPSQPFDTS